MRIPLTKPSPPKLSEATKQLQEIEDRGIFSNFGPVNTTFEKELIDRLFDGQGYCTTVCNATLGLMLAVRHAIRDQKPGERRYALMPSFTFASAAHAAHWCGLTPLFCDIDPDIWAADPQSEEAMLQKYGKEIAVVLPYATFGYDIDMQRYSDLSRQYDVPVVVDGAASLGTKSEDGKGFGTGSDIPIIFSMHATKSFSTGEGGLIYSADAAMIKTLKQMSNFGFGLPRTATMPGLNAKMSEVSSLQALLRLEGFEGVIEYRQNLIDIYRSSLPELKFQHIRQTRQAHQFATALLPPEFAKDRHIIQQQLADDGIGLGTYFSPHLAEQEYFQTNCVFEDLPITNDIASRIISLPLYDTMQESDVMQVAAALHKLLKPKITKIKFPLRIRQNNEKVFANKKVVAVG